MEKHKKQLISHGKWLQKIFDGNHTNTNHNILKSDPRIPQPSVSSLGDTVNSFDTVNITAARNFQSKSSSKKNQKINSAVIVDNTDFGNINNFSNNSSSSVSGSIDSNRDKGKSKSMGKKMTMLSTGSPIPKVTDLVRTSKAEREQLQRENRVCK